MGFGKPPFFFYLFQLKAPRDKTINLSIPRGVREGEHSAGNPLPGPVGSRSSPVPLPHSHQMPSHNGVSPPWMKKQGGFLEEVA